MQTKYWQLDKEKINSKILQQAAKIIKNDGLVAFPTETVYGLGANGLSENAVEKIYLAKGRPSDNPLILHIDDVSWLDVLARQVPLSARKLIERFWPGPLTVVLKKGGNIPELVTAGLDTIAIRMPNHPIALKLIEFAGVPVAAPSANLSGRPSPTTSQAVQEDLDGRIDAVISAGSANIGLESTVVDCTGEIPEILRPGSITKEQLELVVGNVAKCYDLNVKVPRSPGMKYRHYAPIAPLYIINFEVTDDALLKFFNQLLQEKRQVGVLANSRLLSVLPDDIVGLGGWHLEDDLDYIASNLYGWLRMFDEAKVDVVIAQGVKKEGLGQAIMNRMEKAAGLKFLSSETDLLGFFT